MIELSRQAGECAQALRRQRRADPRERDVRAKGPPLELIPHFFRGDLDVVVQELEPGFPFDTHPYDARPPEVRERARAGERHLERAMPPRHPVHGRAQRGHAQVVAVTEELQREVQLVDRHPCQSRLGIAQRCGGRSDLLGRRWRQLKGEEQPHRHRPVVQAPPRGA
jgi:hypothetical protein